LGRKYLATLISSGLQFSHDAFGICEVGSGNPLAHQLLIEEWQRSNSEVGIGVQAG
jgi:hypothetical protein